MHVVLVHVHVKPERVEAFVEATRANREGTRREPGNLRFDVLQRDDDPTRFVIVEVFRSDEAAAAHKATAHYATWRDAVAGWMASPRAGERFRAVAPATADAW